MAVIEREKIPTVDLNKEGSKGKKDPEKLSVMLHLDLTRPEFGSSPVSGYLYGFREKFLRRCILLI